MSAPVYAYPRPLPDGEWPLDDVLEMIDRYSGMTLRDYFAAKSLVAVVMSVTGNDAASKALMAAARVDGVSNEQHMAVVAYRMADAMLKARTA